AQMDPGSAKLSAALALVMASIGAAALRYRPPPARPADAPAQEFSASRAREVLRGLVGDGEPHPTGSPAGARVRQRVVAELERLGYQPRTQEAFACGAVGICARVTNVIARLDGQRAGKGVLLSVHYDSVPAGPGASDDGAGVSAALEIARALKAGPPPERPVLLLLNEGEEDDLLGAEAFVAGDPAAKEVGAVVKLEARGTTGARWRGPTSRRHGGESWRSSTCSPSASCAGRWAGCQCWPSPPRSSGWPERRARCGVASCVRARSRSAAARSWRESQALAWSDTCCFLRCARREPRHIRSSPLRRRL